MDNQNGYTNFNGYQTTPDPTQQQPYQQPVVDPNQQQNPYQAAPQQMPYQDPYQTPYPYAQQSPYAQPQKDNSKTLGILSIVFSSLSIFCCGAIFSITGIILGIVAVAKNKKSALGWIGLAIGVVALIITIVTLVAMGPQYTQMVEDMMNEIQQMQ